jgi:hypothetical protein
VTFFYTDPVPDPALFFSGFFKMPTKSDFFKDFFLLLTTSIFKSNKSQNCRNQGFSNFYLLVGGRIRIREAQELTDPKDRDPDHCNLRIYMYKGAQA